MLTCSITALANDRSTIKAQLEGAVAFITDGIEKYGVDDAYDYYRLVKSEVDLSGYNEKFLADVKSNLENNNGRIVTAYGESLAGYSSVIMVLDLLGEDVTDFNGYNIIDAFSKLDPTAPQANPYFYTTIIPASKHCDKEFAKAICDTFISDNYTVGKGMASYGSFGCDNTAFFINALAPYTSDYEDIMKDAFTVLETYKVDGGYVYDKAYGTQPNADSTALALMAYSSVSDYVSSDKSDSYMKLLSDIYTELCSFESDECGVFIGSYTLEKDYFATKDALIGLEEYYTLLLQNQAEPDTKPDTQPTAPATSSDSNITQSAGTQTKSPQTGSAINTLGAIAALAGAVVITKKHK